jgi:hypothetical protein
MQKQSNSVFMSPMEEMKILPIKLASVTTNENGDEQQKNSPIDLEINTSNASTPSKSAAQLTPTDRKKSGGDSASAESIRKRFSARLNKSLPRQSVRF